MDSICLLKIKTYYSSCYKCRPGIPGSSKFSREYRNVDICKEFQDFKIFSSNLKVLSMGQKKSSAIITRDSPSFRKN